MALVCAARLLLPSTLSSPPSSPTDDPASPSFPSASSSSRSFLLVRARPFHFLFLFSPTRPRLRRLCYRPPLSLHTFLGPRSSLSFSSLFHFLSHLSYFLSMATAARQSKPPRKGPDPGPRFVALSHSLLRLYTSTDSTFSSYPSSPVASQLGASNALPPHPALPTPAFRTATSRALAPFRPSQTGPVPLPPPLTQPMPAS